MTKKKRWELKVVPWLARVGGIVLLYYLLASGNVWFIPSTAFVAYHMGRWAGLRIHGDPK